MSNYDNFVFYGSWRETLEGFREDFGDEYAREALWNLMTMATAGDIETDKKSIIGFVQGACMPNIEAAQDRYERAKTNGKKGGRPKIEIDRDDCLYQKSKLKTWKAVAQYYGIDEDTLRKIRKTWEAEKPKNLEPKNRNCEEKAEKPKNLDIDIDI